jgi:hypothetical protein
MLRRIPARVEAHRATCVAGQPGAQAVFETIAAMTSMLTGERDC